MRTAPLVLTLGLVGPAVAATACSASVALRRAPRSQWSAGPKWAARALAVAALALAAPAAAQEPPAVSDQRVSIAGRTLAYRAEAGRLPIYGGAATPRGEIFYTAYRIPSAKPRPVTFIWNGGPGSPSTLLHFEAFGPKRIEGDRLVDNPATLLTVSDLVFVDPIGTGFSRAADAEAEKAFYSTTGDMAATAEFVQRWRERRGAERQPVYLVGESYGVWRAAGAAERLERDGVRVSGIVLISGGAGVSEALPRPLATAMRVPNRTAAALSHGRLEPALARDHDAALRAAEEWARTRYAPALERAGELSPGEREEIARELHRFTGFPADQVDRGTLAVSPRAYLTGLLKTKGKTLDTFDMRLTGEAREAPKALIGDYFRRELGYRTTLPYVGLEALSPDADARPINVRWNYNSGQITPEVMARAQAGEGPPGAEPWSVRAMAINPGLRVLVAAGLYDSLNSCAANRELAKRLDPSIRGRFQFRCYSGGHMMYRDTAARRQLSADLQQFLLPASGR